MALPNRFSNNQILIGGIAIAASFLLLYTLFLRPKSIEEDTSSGGGDSSQTNKKKIVFDSTTKKSAETKPTTTTTTTKSKPSSDSTTPLKSNVTENKEAEKPKDSTKTSTETSNKAIHAKIEELDKKGKALFKSKDYLEAAQVFSEALDYIDNNAGSAARDPSSSLFRQVVTLMNNRSAMYEKGSLPDLALDDCDIILDTLDSNHTKARTRKIRILEEQNRYYDALVEVCCVQLKFMQENRERFRLGLPVPNPPIPQTKLEELMVQLSPQLVQKQMEKLEEQKKEMKGKRKLPASYTILQLLKSYTGYNGWMAKAAKDGSSKALTETLDSLDEADTATETVAKRCSILMKRGRRYVYDGNYKLAIDDFEQSFQLVKDNEDVQNTLEDDDYARILEWTGMIRHWVFDFTSALTCYQKCADLEPTNSEILVKQAGVKMDEGNIDEALALFEKALELNPNGAPDALLHRANLYMLQQKPNEAKTDLTECIKIRPDHVLARLRLAAISTAMSDTNTANTYLDEAEEIDPKSSDIFSYRGEIAFTQGDFVEAKSYFDKAIELEPNNPTPYVNLALAILNTPPVPQPGQTTPPVPDTKAAIQHLEKAIDVDPMFHAAYVQLGQLKLGTATDLDTAREVLQLYDQALQYCRSPEEIKDLCNMKTLTEAQIDAATALKMETFSMQ